MSIKKLEKQHKKVLEDTEEDQKEEIKIKNDISLEAMKKEFNDKK